MSENRKNGLPIVALLSVLLAGVTIFTVVSGLRGTTKLHHQRSSISALRQRLNTARATAGTAKDQDMFAALGMTSARVTHDQAIISDLAGTAVTWNSGRSYAAARASLERRFKIDTKSQFMRALLPPPAYSTDSQGRRYYYIDAVGMNSRLEQATPEVIGVAGDTYRYAVDVTIDVGDDQIKNSQAARNVLVYLTIDGAGDVSDVSGVIANGETRLSN